MAALWKKVSDILGIAPTIKAPPLDGEIIYCKNNVCVHPPTKLSNSIEHHPGYLTIRAQEEEDSESTLIVTWIPNNSLKKNRKKASKYFSPQGSPVHTRFAHRQLNSMDGISMTSFGSELDTISIASSEAERVITSEIIREKLERQSSAQREEYHETERKNMLASEEDIKIMEHNLQLNNEKRPSNEKLPVGQNVNMLAGKNINSTPKDNGSDSSSTLEGSSPVSRDLEQKPVNTESAVPDTLPISIDNTSTPSDSDTMSPGYGTMQEDGKLAVERQPLLGADSDDPGGKSDAEATNETHNNAMETNSANKEEHDANNLPGANQEKTAEKDGGVEAKCVPNGEGAKKKKVPTATLR